MDARSDAARPRRREGSDLRGTPATLIDALIVDVLRPARPVWEPAGRWPPRQTDAGGGPPRPSRATYRRTTSSLIRHRSAGLAASAQTPRFVCWTISWRGVRLLDTSTVPRAR